MTTRAEVNKAQDCSIICLDRFIQATRDSGYKGTPSAISELVDNAIQAGATQVSITVAAQSSEDGKRVEISVLDNGCGMDPFTLRQALRFGGSTRFGDRAGLGRYGMGLPNASLSQARRVTVYTWQSLETRRKGRSASKRHSATSPDRVYMSYLDVDEIVRGQMKEVPKPKVSKKPPPLCQSQSGTLVLWTHCDRLDNRRVSTIARKLAGELGRRFRHFLWKGLRLTINGDRAAAIDPLFLHSKSVVSGAHLFGDELRYEVMADPSVPQITGWIHVRFSELPVHEWHKLSNEEKRRIGVSKGAGVSVVRAGREVDYGWFFMGDKRRENYDDWWRCEVQFDPVLDEAFGITHTKQQVRPQARLLEALTSDLEATARALNNRARKAHHSAKTSDQFSEAERLASERERLLKPLPKKPSSTASALMKELEKRHTALRPRADSYADESRYRIVEAAVKSTCFFSYAYDGDRLVLVLNPEHPFYREIYKPLSDGNSPRDQQLRAKLELMLLAAARAEAASTSKAKSQQQSRHRQEWSNVLAAFLNG